MYIYISTKIKNIQHICIYTFTSYDPAFLLLHMSVILGQWEQWRSKQLIDAPGSLHSWQAPAPAAPALPSACNCLCCERLGFLVVTLWLAKLVLYYSKNTPRIDPYIPKTVDHQPAPSQNEPKKWKPTDPFPSQICSFQFNFFPSVPF